MIIWHWKFWSTQAALRCVCLCKKWKQQTVTMSHFNMAFSSKDIFMWSDVSNTDGSYLSFASIHQLWYKSRMLMPDVKIGHLEDGGIIYLISVRHVVHANNIPHYKACSYECHNFYLIAIIKCFIKRIYHHREK